MQFDPALKQLLLTKTAGLEGESADAVGAEEVPVLAKLRDPLSPPPGLRVIASFGSIVTGRVRMSDLIRLRAQADVLSLKAGTVIGPTLCHSVPSIGADRVHGLAGGGITGRGVLVAILDWGCDFVHRDLRFEDGSSKLRFLWDQRGGRLENSPEPFGYGREFNRNAINAALATADPYAALGYDHAFLDPHGIGTHGTHVCAIAVGSGSAPASSPGVAPGADLGFVHLRGSDTLPTETLGDSVYLLEAIRYVFDRAGDSPVVINCSLGKHGGPHDGSTLGEQGFDAALLERAGRAVVMSTGNYFSANVHASGTLQAGGITELQWIAAARDDAFSEMEIWTAGGDRVNVELVQPDGVVFGPVAPTRDTIVRKGESVIASIYNRQGDPNNGDNLINIFLWPDAPLGTWTVRLYAEALDDNGEFHAWIERDDIASQSHFRAQNAVVTTTTGTICNGHKTIAVGAYDARDPNKQLVMFSSVGPTRDGRPKPDIVAPGSGIRAARSSVRAPEGRLADGLTIKSGTSMAAPHVAGVLALMFEAAGTHRLDIDTTRRLLLSTAAEPQGIDDEIERLRYGAGTVDASAAVQAVLSELSSTLEPETESLPDAAKVDNARLYACLDNLRQELELLHSKLRPDAQKTPPAARTAASAP